MPLDLPIIPLQHKLTPSTYTPADIQPVLEKMLQGFNEGYLGSQQIQKAATVGMSDATAEKAQNEAKTAKAQQDTIDQQGEQPQSSVFSRLFGSKPQAAAKKTPTPTPNQDVVNASTDALLAEVQKAGYSFIP
jgi:hypothetical protein